MKKIDKTTAKVGFIGLGDMGGPMCKSMVRAGFDVTVCDFDKEKVAALTSVGAKNVSTPREIAQTCNVIVSMVRDNPQTEAVYFGKDGVFETVREGTCIIIMSTIDPSFYEVIGPRAKEKGVYLLDSPVSGGRTHSATGTLTLMVGGDEVVFRNYLPVLEGMGEKIFYQGGLGAGQIVKLVNNAILYMNRAAAIEGIALGIQCGLQRDRIIELVSASTGQSRALEDWHTFPTIDRKLQRKTISLALDIAKRYGAHMPVMGLVSQLPTTQEELDAVSRGVMWQSEEAARAMQKG